MACAVLTQLICYDDAAKIGGTFKVGAAIQETADQVCRGIEVMLRNANEQGIEINSIEHEWIPKEGEQNTGSYKITVRGKKGASPVSPIDSDLNEPLPARTCSEGECCQSCQ